MPIPVAPETRILERMREIIVDNAAAIEVAFDLDGGSLTVRHFRHRGTNSEEKPGIALRYVSSEIDNDRGAMNTSSEQCWAMNVGIVVDLSLLPEAEDPAAPASDANDATGWDRLLAMGHYVARMLVPMTSELRGVVDDVLYGDVDPDEDTQPDEGRLVVALVVLYRTLFEDPLHLLAPEENA